MDPLKAYLGCPEDPFREVLQAMTGQEPPAFVKGYNSNGLTDQQQAELQDWCSLNVKPNWLTGIGLLEAAEQQVQEAVSNGNIPSAVELEQMKANQKPVKSKRAAHKSH